MSQIVVYNIEWSIDPEEALEAVDLLSQKEVTELFPGIKPQYLNSPKHRRDVILDAFHHCPALMDELFQLPEEIAVPDDFGIASLDDDFGDVAEWLSDTYGFCVLGFQIKEVQKNVK